MEFMNTGNLWNMDADTGMTTIALPVLSYMYASNKNVGNVKLHENMREVHRFMRESAAKI